MAGRWLAGLLLAQVAYAGVARAAPETPVTITVAAEAIDRKDTPVSFPLPRELPRGDGRFQLRGPRGERLPVEVDPGEPQARFLLPALGPGKQVSYQLVRADGSPPTGGAASTGGAAATGKVGARGVAATGVEVRQEADALVVTADGAPVFHFRTRAPAATEAVPARFTRAGYLHPVFSPGGVVVTDDSPADHGHHHGIWTAWTVTEFEGRRLGFWGPEPGRSKNDLVSVGEVWSGAVAGGFAARLASTDLSVKPAKQVLDSSWKVVVHRVPGRRYFLFDLDWTDQVVGQQPLLLPEYRYGGLGLRGNREWIDPMRVTFLTSEGKDRLTGENTRARWVHLGGRVGVGAKEAGVAVLIHPLNLRAPEPVRLNPGIPLLCVAPPKAGPLRIEPGHPYAARYRFVVTDGRANVPLLERLWRDFARPPKVTVGAPVAAAGE